MVEEEVTNEGRLAGAAVVTSDCRADAKRAARPARRRPSRSRTSARPTADTDWLKLADLRRGRLYTITATAVDRYTRLSVVDAQAATPWPAGTPRRGGSTGTVRFRPTANGTYFLDIPNGYHRTLSME